MAIVYRFHLDFPECSGLAVQFQVLTDSQMREAQVVVMKSASKDATIFDVRELEKRECIKRMLTHVSDGPAQPPVTDETKWVPVDLQKLEDPLSPLSFDKLFSLPKDVAVLEKLFEKFHELTLSEIGSIEGKLIPVSLG